jgi:hypothetical protein
VQQAPPEKANPFEIIGAWLHVWTPPRGVEIPPVPWRKLAIGTGIGALIVGIALAILVPRIDETKDRNAAEEAAFRAQVQREQGARITYAQRATMGEAKALAPAAGASASEIEDARAKLREAMEADLYAAAKARGASGEIKPVTGPPTCERAPGTPEAGGYGVFDCFLPTAKIAATERNMAGSLGYPWRAVLHYDTFTYAYCRSEPIPGEKAVVTDNQAIQLPAACQREQS